ncbi:peptidase [Zhengella mangrovi]|uniref:Peptidase n=1 Tax=Zhengella mangrovi TaxID=1982044 RepID=A0A2G1QH44_9HYPH|nr:DUF922 domain-containing protein [Zhengella mangrovi]PHP64843.1 peptidase [Zhengella mangrovi]
MRPAPRDPARAGHAARIERRRRRTGLRPLLANSIAALALIALPARAADWKATERVATYSVSGETGLALYRSIGENGPRLGPGASAIAHTSFELKWRRDYRPDGTACQLRSALPFLTITTTLPKPSAPPTGATARRWKTFIDGITAHEAIHSAMIHDLVRAIIAGTVGTRTENDPRCTKIRPLILQKVKAAYARHQARSRAFDKDEMGRGGNVEGLVRGLVE